MNSGRFPSPQPSTSSGLRKRRDSFQDGTVAKRAALENIGVQENLNETYEVENTSIFRKRVGTTHYGDQYEDLNVANIILNIALNKEIDCSELSSNDVKFGMFDDIVFKVKCKYNTWKKFAIQLKYFSGKDKSRPFREANLRGDFDIQKYCNFYNEITQFIGILNYYKAEFEYYREECLDYCRTNFRYISMFVEELKQNDYDVVKRIEELEEYINSYELILFTNRACGIEEGAVIHLNRLRCSVRLMRCEPELLQDTSQKRSKCQFELTWCDQRYRRVYSKFFSKFSIYSSQADVHQTRNFVSTNLQHNFLCGEEAFDKYYKFVEEWSKKEGEKEKLTKTVAKRIIALSVFSPYIKRISFGDATSKMRFLQSLFTSCNVNIVEGRSCERIRRNWEDIIKGNINNIHKIRGRYGLSNSENDIALWILDKIPLCVEANETTSKVINFCPNQKYIVIGNHHVNKISSEIEKFRNLTDLSVDKCRKISEMVICSLQGRSNISLQTLIDEEPEIKKIVTTDVLLEMCETEVFNIGGGKEEFSEEYIERNLSEERVKSSFLDKIDRNTVAIIGSDNVLTEEICRNYNFRDIDDKNLLYSQNDIDEMRLYSVKVNIDERNLCARQSQNCLNLIIGEPGMGKSLMLKHLKNCSSPNQLVFILSANEITHLCEKFRRNKPTNYEIMEILKEFICNDSFCQILFKMMFTKKQVILMFDALDELLNEDLETAIKIIQDLSQKNFTLFVTSRTRLQTYLETKLHVFSKNIIPLTREQQITYMSQHFPNEDNSKIIQTATNLFNYEDILGNPLYISMLTEILEDLDIYTKFKSKIFSIIDLFTYFIDKKFDNYSQKFGNVDFRLKKNLEQQKINKIYRYQEAALKLLIPSVLPENTESEDVLEQIKSQGDPEGIVVNVNDNNLPDFRHLAFAEYFVALYFSKNYKNIKNFPNILFEEKHSNIRFYFDLFLAKDCPAHIALLYKNTEVLRRYDEDVLLQKDLGGRNLMHLAASWGQTFPRSGILLDDISDNKYEIMDISALNKLKKEDTKFVEMMLYVSEVCDLVEHDGVFDWTPLSYAENSNALLEKTIILKSQNKKYATFEDSLHMAGVIYCSAKFGYDHVVDIYSNFPYIFVDDPFEDLLDVAANSKSGALFAFKLLATEVYKPELSLSEMARIIGQIFDRVDAIKKKELLHYCYDKFEKESIRVLKESNVDVNFENENKKTPLHLACFGGQEKLAELLLQLNPNLIAKDVSDKTPLDYAYEKGHENIVKLIVGCSETINVKDVDTFDTTSLHWACQNGREDILRTLLPESKSMLDICDKYGKTPLHYASLAGFHTIAQVLLISSANANSIDFAGKTPLCCACEQGHEKVVELLLKYGADVNIASRNEKTALHYTCEKGDTNLVKLLLKSNADVNWTDSTQKTALHLASENGNANVVKLLLELRADFQDLGTTISVYDSSGNIITEFDFETSINEDTENERKLYVCCNHGEENLVKKVYDIFVLVNIRDIWGKTALHYASALGDKVIVELLLDSGAFVNLSDNTLKTPLHYACRNRRQNVVRLLLDRNADVNLLDIDEMTALHYACGNAAESVVKLLLEANVDIDLVNLSGESALFYGVESRSESIVRLLLERSANVNITNMGKQTPLFYACINGDANLVKLLLDAGASVDLADVAGKTPLHHSSKKGYQEIVKLLLGYKADVNFTDIMGKKAIDYARENGHEKVVELLQE